MKNLIPNVKELKSEIITLNLEEMSKIRGGGKVEDPDPEGFN